jgi:hypothetical protein
MAKRKAKNQKDTDSTYSNTGGFQFTLPDEVRLKNKIESIIKEYFIRGASWMDIRGEVIYIELDNFKDKHLVADRRKKIALDALVEEGILTVQGRTKKYTVVSSDDTIPLSEKVWVIHYFTNCITISVYIFPLFIHITKFQQG